MRDIGVTGVQACALPISLPPGYGSGHADVFGVKVGVEGNEEGARAHGHGSSARVELGWTIVRLPEWITHAGGEALVTPATDVREVPPVRSGRRGLVEVDGEAQGTDFLPRQPGQPGGILERRTLERHEGQHVERAHRSEERRVGK